MSTNVVILKSKTNKTKSTWSYPTDTIPIDHFFRKKIDDNSPPREEKIVNVYCDGSTINNGRKNASGGIGIYFGDGDQKNCSEPYLLEVPTNQRTELYALMRTLQILDKMVTLDQNTNYHFHIYTDSEYVINCLENWIPNWSKHEWIKSDGKHVKNVNLLKSIASLYYAHQQRYKLHHVMAHTGQQTEHAIGNANADRLAVQGSHQHPNFTMVMSKNEH
jgi:ribonuclease HI